MHAQAAVDTAAEADEVPQPPLVLAVPAAG
jgi:hypothetical protein